MEQLNTIFTRKTSHGLLVCQLNNTTLEFSIDGVKREKASISDIVSMEDLAARRDKGSKELFAILDKAGAVATWNFQIALYNGEPELIEAAIAKAKAKEHQDELGEIAASDIVVTEVHYNGAPAMAENASFAWHHIQGDFLSCRKRNQAIYQLAYMHKDRMGSEDITDETVIAAVRKFHRVIDLMTKHAETAYKAKKEAEFLANLEDTNPDSLSLDQIKEKAQAWDNIYNEGEGEGYNPYRNI